jgi:hypothetical protein
MPQMIARIDSSQLEPVLLALGLQWAGAMAVRDDITDPGLALWCGLLEAKRIVDVLERLHPAHCESLRAALEHLMVSRSSLDPGLLITTDVPPDWTAALTEAWPSAVPVLPPLILSGVHVLRLWARWLRGISNSGVPSLLRNLVRRSGRIEVRSDRILVKMGPLPLDVVLEMAGYLGETPAIPWLGDRRIFFRIERNFA